MEWVDATKVKENDYPNEHIVDENSAPHYPEFKQFVCIDLRFGKDTSESNTCYFRNTKRLYKMVITGTDDTRSDCMVNLALLLGKEESIPENQYIDNDLIEFLGICIAG